MLNKIPKKWQLFHAHQQKLQTVMSILNEGQNKFLAV